MRDDEPNQAEAPHCGDPRFWLLLDAVLVEPQKLHDIVQADPTVLEAKDNVGETVLHWLSIEGRIKEIEMLRSLGARIPENAIVQAIDAGETATVARLFELGGTASRFDCETTLENPIWGHSKEHVRLVRSYLDQFVPDA